jgi:hypothetical protein
MRDGRASGFARIIRQCVKSTGGNIGMDGRWPDSHETTKQLYVSRIQLLLFLVSQSHQIRYHDVLTLWLELRVLARSSPFCPCRYRNGSKRIGGKPYLEYRWPEHHVCVKIIAQDRRRKRGVADLIHRLQPSTILGEKCDIPLHGDMLIFHPPKGLDACVVCSVYGSWRLCEVLPMPFTSGGFGHAS